MSQFCHRHLPKEMTLLLRDNYDRLLRHQEASSRSLDWTESIDFCVSHENVTATIPLGKQAGWPVLTNVQELAERVLHLSASSRSFIQWRGVKFFEKASRAFRKKGEVLWRSDHEKESRESEGRLLPG